MTTASPTSLDASTPSERHALVRALGFAKYLYNQGKEWTDIVRGSLTPILLAGYMADQKGHSLAIGMVIPAGIVVIGVLFGLIVWRWNIAHHTIEKEWENNPYLRTHIDTLRSIDKRLANIERLAEPNLAVVAIPPNPQRLD